jgi:hypothetical protein
MNRGWSDGTSGNNKIRSDKLLDGIYGLVRQIWEEE